MADFDALPFLAEQNKMRRFQQEQNNPMDAFLKGYQAGAGMRKERGEDQQKQASQQALQGYVQTGDINAAKGDPKTYLDLQKRQIQLDDTQRKRISGAIELHDEMKYSTYGNLDYYNTKYRPAMLKAGVPEEMLPEYKSVEELNKGLTMKEQMAAKFKQMGLGVKVQGGYAIQGDQLTPLPERPMTQYQREHLRQGDEALDIKRNPPEKPGKAEDIAKIEKEVTASVDKDIKVNKRSAEDFDDQAKADILKGKTFPTSSGIMGLGPTKQVPFDQLPEKEQEEASKKYTSQIEKRKKELFSKDRQAAIDAGVQKRRGEGGGRSRGQSKRVEDLSTDELRQMIQQKKGGGATVSHAADEEDEED